MPTIKSSFTDEELQKLRRLWKETGARNFDETLVLALAALEDQMNYDPSAVKNNAKNLKRQ